MGTPTTPLKVSKIQRMLMTKELTDNQFNFIINFLEVFKDRPTFDAYGDLVQKFDSMPEKNSLVTSAEGTQEKEPTMRYEFDNYDDDGPRMSGTVTEIDRQRSYLTGRLTGIVNDKEELARSFFGLVDDDRPRSPKEVVDRILAGQIVLPKDADKPSWECPLNRIRWRDPAKVENTTGFQTFLKTMETASVETLDTIITTDAATGLKAMQAFKELPIQ